jgi:hypothetical protein
MGRNMDAHPSALKSRALALSDGFLQRERDLLQAHSCVQEKLVRVATQTVLFPDKEQSR